jgi:hypothetical protein
MRIPFPGFGEMRNIGRLQSASEYTGFKGGFCAPRTQIFLLINEIYRMKRNTRTSPPYCDSLLKTIRKSYIIYTVTFLFRDTRNCQMVQVIKLSNKRWCPRSYTSCPKLPPSISRQTVVRHKIISRTHLRSLPQLPAILPRALR